MTNEEIKSKIKELEKQKQKIIEEIITLRNINKGYWIGIGDNDYSYKYFMLGWCTEYEAEEEMKKHNFVLGYKIKEVTKEYYEKLWKAQKMQKVVEILEEPYFSHYSETKDSIDMELYELTEELDISPCGVIY